MKKKILITTGILVVLILNLLVASGIFTNDVIAAENTNSSMSVSSSGAECQVQPGKLVDTYDAHGAGGYYLCGDFESTSVNGSEEIPAYGDYQIYCTQEGTPADVLRPLGTLTKAEAEALDGYTDYNGHGEAEKPHEGEFSHTFFEGSGSGKLAPWEAYVISDEPLGVFSEEKQNALWGRTNRLYTEGLDYQEFDQKVRAKQGLDPKDNTESSKVKVGVEEGQFVIGPYNMSYTEGTYGGVTFGGIYDMKVRGYNKDGTMVKDDIEISQILIDGERKEPEYFEPEECLFVDREEQVYPESDEDFRIVIQDPNAGLDPNDPDRIVAIDIKVTFRYMLTEGNKRDFDGKKYQITYDEEHNTHYHTDDEGNRYQCHSCYVWGIHDPLDKQDVMCADAFRELYEQELILTCDEETKIQLTMNLGGYVWEEILQGKESLADGLRTEEDIKLKNIRVTLYYEDGEKVEVSGPSPYDPDKDTWHHINSTLTDEEGYYQFNELDSQKRYYVVFEYDGQTYLPTDYKRPEYNTEEWKVTSKATEDNGDRDAFDNRFSEIGAAPKNYPSTDSLSTGQLVDGHNQSYTKLDLMGYEQDENGNYSKTGTQLIDGYEYDERGLQTTEYTYGSISETLRSWIESNKRFPSDDELISIYKNIAGGDTETLKMIQFVQDCKIESYTGNLVSGGSIDTYPYYEYGFYINKVGMGDTGRGAELQHDQSDLILEDGTVLKPIYDGQYFINLGLWRRQEFDMALRKDAYKIAMKMNDKTLTYNYNKRIAEEAGANNPDGDDNNTYWDINVRMSDYEAYYNTGYNREIYQSDYEYDSTALGHPGHDLEIYVTYKITVRNQSQTVVGEIKEVVDYYDSEFTYKPNLSWIMYQTDDNINTSVDEDEYYEMMDQDQEVIDAESTQATSFISSSKEAKASEETKYSNTEKDLGEKYNNLYVQGLEGKKLQTGESAYIYLTFEVNKDGSDRVILDDEGHEKDNIAEINGYSTYYRDGTTLPNGVTKGSGDIAGLLDRDSTPGNLVAEDLEGEKYEKNFEDDTDRAPGLRIHVDPDAVRRANGTVWEDERTETVGNGDSASVIGDGIRQEGEIGISGATVQLVEKCVDGSEYIWQETTSGSDGKYAFEGYIPGDYVIRFYYGDTERTVLTSDNGGQNVVSYNGQDFKSTTYQDGIEQNGTTDIDGRYQGYINTATQNVSGTYNPNENAPTEDTYGYDIYKADSDSTNYSDAKDLWTIEGRDGLNIIGQVSSARPVQGRDTVIDYSSTDVTNHKAEVRASPYQRPIYNGTEYTDAEMSALYAELMDNTYMTAETGVIVAEFEYDRQQSDGDKGTENNSENSSKDYVGDNKFNSSYSLNNIDLGLTERPKAQLEIDKSVTNVKVTLANNSILFDINEAANNALWQDHDEYSVDEEMRDGKYEEYYNEDHRYAFREEIDDIVRRTDRGLIQLTMDEELMHGATIQVTYNVKVTNVGEVDYVDGDNKNFYYRGNTEGAHVVTTTTEQVVDYVRNNYQFEANNETNSGAGWSVITDETLMSEGLVNERYKDNLAQFNNIIQTEKFGETSLLPGAETSQTVILSQLITPENTADDLTYTNMVEILKTSNEVGRRMAYSVVGNQDPVAEDAAEIDANVGERIVILPPFGSTTLYYIIGGLVIALLLAGGIILIKVKVLKKKE